MTASSSAVTRVVTHLQALVEEGKRVAKLERPSSFTPFIQGEDKVPLHAWLTQTKNIVERVFGTDSAHYHHLMKLTESHVEHAHSVLPIVGLLEGCKNDLTGGFLLRQEELLSAALFDSVLDQAEHLVAAGHKDPAAVLGRVVLEDCLRRLAAAEGLNDTQKAALINDDLKKAGRLTQPQWRQVQVWLDLGNAAAHGDFAKYDGPEVKRMIEDIRRFSANELGTHI